MFIKNKKKMFLLISAAVITFFGCATNEKPTAASAKIDYYFVPDTSLGKGSVSFYTNNAYWTIEKAGMIAGEIGVHWEEASAPRSADYSDTKLRHDVPGGKISPKIYGFFAINLLDTNFIQTLTVEDGRYSHIHMVVTTDDRANELREGLDVTNIEKFPQLKGKSYYFSGTVSADDANVEKYPFELYSSKEFDENTLGDIMFNLSIYDHDYYNFYLSPKLQSWFAGIQFILLRPNENGVIIINETNHAARLADFEGKFTDRNPMVLRTPKKTEN